MVGDLATKENSLIQATVTLAVSHVFSSGTVGSGT
jgi:hypothetical protein